MREDRHSPILPKPVHLPKAEAQRQSAIRTLLEYIIPFAMVHINGPHFDIMFAGIADNLRRGIEAHRL